MNVINYNNHNFKALLKDLFPIFKANSLSVKLLQNIRLALGLRFK